MRVALYARCSTTDQSVDLQLDGLREYARSRGFTVVEDYVDNGISGTKTTRPALDQLLADAHRRRFDAVLIWKLDRLGRSLSHLLHIVGELEAFSVDLISLDDAIDTSTPAGRLFFSIRGAFAEYERSLIRERAAAGIEAARRRGKHLGRPRSLAPAETERVRRLRRSGHSIRAIADAVGVSKSVVARELSQKVPAEIGDIGPLSG